MTDPAPRLLDALAAARRVAGTTDYARGGASGRLEARVSPRREDRAVVLEETGRWRGDGLELAVRDATLWTREGPEVVGVAHLRRGADDPARLGALRCRSPGRWTTTSPHECGRDRYRARVRLDGASVVLAWRVVGPDTEGTVRRAYRPEDVDGEAALDPAPSDA